MLIVPRNDIYEHSEITNIRKFTLHLRRLSETLVRMFGNMQSKCIRMFVRTSLYEMGPRVVLLHNTNGNFLAYGLSKTIILIPHDQD